MPSAGGAGGRHLGRHLHPRSARLAAQHMASGRLGDARSAAHRVAGAPLAARGLVLVAPKVPGLRPARTVRQLLAQGLAAARLPWRQSHRPQLLHGPVSLEAALDETGQ